MAVNTEMLRRLGQSQANGETGSKTDIECVMEGALMQRGVTYRTQVELGLTRFDAMVFNEDGTATGIQVDGSYWHQDQLGHDYGKMLQVIGFEVEGHTLTNAVRVLDTDLLGETDWTVDAAVRGEQVRVLS